MLFQWYLFAFLVLLYVVAKASNQSYRVWTAGGYEKRYKWFTALMVIAVLTFVAATRDIYFADTMAYANGFRRTEGTWENVWQTLCSDTKDRGYYALVALLKMLIGDRFRVYFGIIAGFCLFCVIGVYRKHSANFFMTIFLFLASGEYVQWTHNGMRQFFAVAMSFAALELLLHKKYLRYIAVILVASSFHASVLIMIPLIFVVQGPAWNKRTVLTVLAVGVATSASDTVMALIAELMANTQYANEVDQFLATGGTGIFRVLVFCIPPVMALLFLKPIRELNSPIINLSVNMSIVSMALYIVSMVTSGIFIGRLPIYCSLYNYMLLPWIIDRMFEKGSAKLVMLVAMGCYMVYYYYQMHLIWGF